MRSTDETLTVESLYFLKDEKSCFVFDDAFEETKEERDFHSSRRYFASDEVRSSFLTSSGPSDRVPSLPVPLFDTIKLSPDASTDASENLSVVFNQLKTTTKCLIVLYSRIIVLRVLHSIPRLPSDFSQDIAKFFLQKSVKLNEGLTNNYPSKILLDELLTLLRLCGMTTNRTKIYLLTMSILPSTQPPPMNLGSLFSTGGMIAYFSCFVDS
jgi:hypothetical protein